MKKNGEIVFVGAGPGDPDLITRRGWREIQASSAIVVDALVDPALVRSFRKKIVYVGKRGPGAPSGAEKTLPQSKINRLLIRLAKNGHRVVRLKGGDPFVFGRGGEETAALRAAGIPYRIVPGVTAGVAAPASAGIPLTHRGLSSQVTFLTGHEDRARPGDPSVDWRSLSPSGTLVVFMGVKMWPLIRRRLLRFRWPKKTPVIAIESATTPRQRNIPVTLDDSESVFRRRRLRAPAVIVVGRVAGLGKKLSWGENRLPLAGWRVVVTRSADQKEELSAMLADLGAEPIACPAIRFEARFKSRSMRAVRTALKKNAFDRILFFSENGVRFFTAALKKEAASARGIPAAAVGPSTAFVARSLGWRVTATPRSFNAAQLARALGNLKGQKILIPRVEGGPQDAVRILRRRGAVVTEAHPYRTVAAPRPAFALKRKILDTADAVVFTSGSTARNFLGFFSKKERGILFRHSVAVSIGPATSSTLRSMGVPTIIEAQKATAGYLAKILAEHAISSQNLSI